MKLIGEGSYGKVLTDGRHAYKFFKIRSDLDELSRVSRVLIALNKTNIGSYCRPSLRAPKHYLPKRPCLQMELYPCTLHESPIRSHEKHAFNSFLEKCAQTLMKHGVCYRDFKLSNICRRKSNFVLIDLDSAFFIDDARKLEPPFGSYCPFFSQPRVYLSQFKYTSWFDPAVCTFTMLFSIAVVSLLANKQKWRKELQPYLTIENLLHDAHIVLLKSKLNIDLSVTQNVYKVLCDNVVDSDFW